MTKSEMLMKIADLTELVDLQNEELKKENNTFDKDERVLKLHLSDEDCLDLLYKAGQHGLTVSVLLENFIRDLVLSSKSNGSDEELCALNWFNRCWFSNYPELTLLNHMLSMGQSPEQYIDALDDLKQAEIDKKNFEVHPENYDNEEMSFIDDDIEYYENIINDFISGWKPDYKIIDMNVENEIIKRWLREKKALGLL